MESPPPLYAIIFRRNPMSSGLQERAIRAAQAALDDHEFVSAVDILVGMGWIHPVNVEAWRKGRLSCLEEHLPVSLERVTQTFEIVREWALARGLTPFEAAYQAPARAERKLLQFTRFTSRRLVSSPPS